MGTSLVERQLAQSEMVADTWAQFADWINTPAAERHLVATMAAAKQDNVKASTIADARHVKFPRGFDASAFLSDMIARASAAGVTVHRSDNEVMEGPSGAPACSTIAGDVWITPGVSDRVAIPLLFHELGHVFGLAGWAGFSLPFQECTAQVGAYLAMKDHGIDAWGFCRDYIAGYPVEKEEMSFLPAASLFVWRGIADALDG